MIQCWWTGSAKEKLRAVVSTAPRVRVEKELNSEKVSTLNVPV